MGMFDKFLDVMRLEDDDDYEDDFDEYDEEEEKKPLFGKRKKDDEDDYDDEPEPSRTRVVKATPSSKVTPIRGTSSGTRRSGGASSLQVCAIKPNSFEDTREITETLLSNRVVILNMEGIDLALAQRIIDFVSGSCYAIDGTLQKISNYIFILAPASVDITGDLQGIMEAFDFSGIQTGF